MKFSSYIIIPALLFFSAVSAQHYNAIHGSNYAGSLGVYNNPSSIVSVPYKWDLTVVGLQFQTITNAVRGPNFPFNLSPASSYYAANGNYKRYGDVNTNLRLLNGRFSIDRNNAFAFGLNFRGYSQINTGKINYTDSVLGPRSFLFLNESNRVISMKMATSLWMELYGSYARTIWDHEVSRLNAGATLKLLRGMSGAFARVEAVGIASGFENDQTVYMVIDGFGRYGYSSNHGNGESFTPADFFSSSKTGLAVDLGVEYFVKTQAVTSVYDENPGHDYEWKIGLSLLDLGWNNYAYSSESRSVSQFNEDITSVVLNEKFRSVQNMSSFNDSVATIVNVSEPLSGNFRMTNPARAVVNVDKYISGNVFVNAELSLNLAGDSDEKFAVKESKLFTVTPRWETRRLGFYAPVQVTRHGNFWIGAAVKAGPLLIGTHNLLNAFFKNKYVAGGAYVALVIRPVQFIRDARNRQYECPEY